MLMCTSVSFLVTKPFSTNNGVMETGALCARHILNETSATSFSRISPSVMIP
jgi:hypothetical protein